MKDQMTHAEAVQVTGELNERVAGLEQGLRDIIQSANNSREMSKRTQWIRARAQSALDGDLKYREVEFPKNGSRRLQLRLVETKLLLDEANEKISQLTSLLTEARTAIAEPACNPDTVVLTLDLLERIDATLNIKRGNHANQD